MTDILSGLILIGLLFIGIVAQVIETEPEEWGDGND